MGYLPVSLAKEAPEAPHAIKAIATATGVQQD